MYFIACITGRVGGAAARELLKKGKKIRTLVRDPSKALNWTERGVEVLQGDLTDPAAVGSALAGVEGAFLMQPTPFGVEPDFPEAKALTVGIVDGLRRSPPPKLIVLSSVGSEQTKGLGNIMQTHLLEQALSDWRFPIAIVRAASFLENHLGAFKQSRSTGYLDSFLQPPSRAIPMVASEDIGKEVALLLMTDWTSKRVVELGSRTTPDELARAASKVLGQIIKARAIPREQWKSRLEAMGLSQGQIGPWTEMQDGFNSGWIDFGRPDTEPVAASITAEDVFKNSMAFL